jgi:hypothetical protein
VLLVGWAAADGGGRGLRGRHQRAGVRRAVDRRRMTKEVRAGTMLAREWNGQMHRVAVLAKGFSWNGNIYPSLSKIALAITGSRWNGPRFFGLRDKPATKARP